MSETEVGEDRTIALSHASMEDGGTKEDEKNIADVETGKQESSQQTSAPAVEFPEGGLRGWATVVGAFCIQFCGFGYTSSFGVYQDYYTRTYITNESASTISWIGSMNAFVVVSGGLFAGQLYDRGHFKLAMYGGSFLLSFGLFMLSLAQPDSFYQMFLSQGICAGIGAGLIYVPSIAVISHYFQKRRTLAMSIVAAGSSLGSVIHPIMLNNTFHKLGFGNSVRASAGLVTGMLLIACLLMRPRLPPPAKVTPLIPSLKKFARDKAYVCAALGMFFFTIGFYYPLYYLQLDASQHNLSENFAFYSLVILNFCSLLGRLSSAFVAHKFGPPIIITISCGVCFAVVFGMIGVHSVAGVVLVGIFFGFFAGAYIALNAPLLAMLADDFSEIGLRMGVAFAVSAFGALIAGPISGALLTSKYEWWRPAVFSGTMACIGFCFFVAMCILLRTRSR